MKKSMPQIEIERISSDIIRAFSGDTIPEQIDIDSLVKDYLGYAIIYEHFADKSRQGFTSDGITTLSIIRDDCVKDFVFPSNTIVIDSYYRDGKHEEQRRFILAHEVGHIINNRVQGKNDAHYFTDSGSYANSSSFLHIKENMSYEETVANRYAAALLMPDFVVSNLIKKHHGGKKFTSSVNFPYGSYYVRELTTDMWHYTDSNAYPFEYTRPSSRTEVNNIVSLGIGNSVVNTPENPSICTTMTYNGQHLAPANTVVSLVDRVWYENLKPWQQYEMHGTIMLVHEDGTYEEYMDVGPVVFSTTDIVSGYVDVPFEVDTTGMAGMNLVAFERLTHGSVTVAVHMDINADIQTIHIPSIGTTATVNSSHEFDVTDEIVLTDTVEFVNLIPGRTYRVDGILMDKTYNTPLGVNGSMVTSSATFVPTSPNGTVEVTFRFDGSVLHNNQELVVFERVFDVETNTLVGRHEDFDSPSQTVIVRVPSPTPTPTTPNPSTTPRTSVTPTPTPVGPGTPSTGEGFNYLLMIGVILVVCGGFTIIRITTDKKLKNSEDKTED